MGTNPADARFVPPPPEYVMEAMGDLKKFFYSHEDLPVLIKAGLIHSQFETIHPFLDGNVISWLDFFLKGIVRIAEDATETSNKVIELREKDLHKVSELGRASKNAIVLLKNLYRIPIINVRKIEEVANLSREAANQLVDRFVKLGILAPKDKGKKPLFKLPRIIVALVLGQ